MIANSATFRSLGFELVHAEPGRATVRVTVRPEMTNSHGICHGGYLFLLADEAFAIAGNAARPGTVAASASIEFLAPAQVGQVLEATCAESLDAGRRWVFDAVVTADGTPVVAFRGMSARMRTSG